MLFSDRGGVVKRNIESQGTLGFKDGLGDGFNTKPISSPTEKVGNQGIQRPMKD